MSRRMKTVVSVLLIIAILIPITSYAGFFSTIKSAIQSTAKTVTTSMKTVSSSFASASTSRGAKSSPTQKDTITSGKTVGSGIASVSTSSGTNRESVGVVPGVSIGATVTGSKSSLFSALTNNLTSNIKGVATGVLSAFSGKYQIASTKIKPNNAKDKITGSNSVQNASSTGTKEDPDVVASLRNILNDGKSTGNSNIKIKKDLKNKTGQKPGNTITFDATAKGDHLQYQWYVKRDGDAEYKKWTGQTSGKLSYTLKKEDEGMQVYCVITDKNGNKKATKASTVSYASKTSTAKKSREKGSLEIVYTGDKKTCEEGETATLELKSKSEKVSQWRIMNEKGLWEKLGEQQSKVVISFDDVKVRYPLWDGNSLIPVKFSCITNTGNHYEAIIYFGKEATDIGQPDQTTIIAPGM